MSRRKPARGCARLVLLALFATGCSQPADEPVVGEWRQFRGPAGLGISIEEDLPVRWGRNSENIRWRTPVPGSGNSSPIVSGGRVFLTAAYGLPDDDWGTSLKRRNPKRLILAYDLASGQKLWETIVFEGPVGKMHWTNTAAAPTPVTDGQHVFVSFDAHLAALGLDGNIVWHRDLDPDYYQGSFYGVASSPVLAGDMLVLLQDRETGDGSDPGWIAAFDKQTGEQVWRDEWMHTCCSYSTPLVVERAGRLEIWSQTTLEVNAYDARTGEKLWQVGHPTTQPVPSLVRYGDLFSAPGGMHNQAMEMFRLDEQHGDADPIRIWSSDRSAPEISSPVLYREKVFSVTRAGILFIRDAQTGEILSRRRLPPGRYQPSLVAGDGKVYVPNSGGLTVVLGVDGDEVTVLSRNRLKGGSAATPAIADGSLIFRSKSELIRIDKERSAAGAGDSPAPTQAGDQGT